MLENLGKSKTVVETIDGMVVASRHSKNAVNLEKRRRLAKLAVGAPVLMTLASRPVLAGQCLSNMMSGNLSNPSRGQCSTGWGPSAWGQPIGYISGIPTIQAWSPLIYGAVKPNGNPAKYADYTGGSTLQDVPSMLNKGVPSKNKLLRDVLTDPKLNQLTSFLVCAYLNASLSERYGSTFHYILSKQDVLSLAAGTMLPPHTSLLTFLGSTWT